MHTELKPWSNPTHRKPQSLQPEAPESRAGHLSAETVSHWPRSWDAVYWYLKVHGQFTAKGIETYKRPRSRVLGGGVLRNGIADDTCEPSRNATLKHKNLAHDPKTYIFMRQPFR